MTPAPGPADVRALRDKGNLARLMILRALARGPARTLRQLADEVGITVQAVSEHLKRLAADGFVTPGEAGTRLTTRGHAALGAQLAALKEYVDGAVRELARIDATGARAGSPVRAGETVGLFMEAGELVAYPGRDSPSRGRARQDAAAGQDVLVDGLEGIVSLVPGGVVFGVLPDAESGGSRGVDLDRARRLVDVADVVVVIGPVARHVAQACGAQPVRFGAPWVAAEASLRGVTAVVLVEQGDLGELTSRYARARETLGGGADPRAELLF